LIRVDENPEDPQTVNELIEILSIQLNEPVMKSTARLMIIISLALNKKLTFTDLLEITSLGKGSLSNHLDKLKEGGLINIKTVFSGMGPRVLIEITREGMLAYENYSKILKKLLSH
jgi:DNA-binding transcriptional ArsR family regulator